LRKEKKNKGKKLKLILGFSVMTYNFLKSTLPLLLNKSGITR